MGEFVPIGDIAFDLPGVPAKALSDRAPQARQHFTRLDQLVDASAADADLGHCQVDENSVESPRRYRDLV